MSAPGPGQTGAAVRLPLDNGLPRIYEGRMPALWRPETGRISLIHAFFVIPFTVATFHDHIGTGRSYREKYPFGTFGLASHFTGRLDARLAQGDPVRINTQLLGFDEKRLWFMHLLRAGDDPEPVATMEMVTINVHQIERRSAPWPDEIKARLAAVWAVHERCPRPPQAGRALGRLDPD
ncbi:MAG: hypothetical protein U1E97_06110 [Alphaproteobacteria bacterium]